MKRIATLLIGMSLMLAVPGSALAASSTCEAYNPQLCSSVGATTTGTSPTGTSPADTTATGTSSSGSTLPFTGLDAVLLVAGGGTLLGTGLIVRRLARSVN
jgi:hypothetical protein